MLTCKDFLTELNDYLDETTQASVREEVEHHLADCPNCWVICDTARKTIRILKGTDLYPLPAEVHGRLMAALQKRMGRA